MLGTRRGELLTGLERLALLARACAAARSRRPRAPRHRTAPRLLVSSSTRLALRASTSARQLHRLASSLSPSRRPSHPCSLRPHLAHSSHLSPRSSRLRWCVPLPRARSPLRALAHRGPTQPTGPRAQGQEGGRRGCRRCCPRVIPQGRRRWRVRKGEPLHCRLSLPHGVLVLIPTFDQADWKEGFKKKQAGVSDMTLLSTISNDSINDNLKKRCVVLPTAAPRCRADPFTVPFSFENGEIYVRRALVLPLLLQTRLKLTKCILL